VRTNVRSRLSRPTGLGRTATFDYGASRLRGEPHRVGRAGLPSQTRAAIHPRIGRAMLSAINFPYRLEASACPKKPRPSRVWGLLGGVGRWGVVEFFGAPVCLDPPAGLLEHLRGCRCDPETKGRIDHKF
jgi:hypothetical protein